MATQEQVKTFLKEFFAKKKVFGIYTRDDRGKNLQALVQLNMTRIQREEVIDTLTYLDYLKGPTIDLLNSGAEMWEFGKVWKKFLLYIKISMGNNNRPVVCISFHEAEHNIQYPFKKT